MHVDIEGWVNDFREEWEAGDNYFAVMGALQDLHNGLFFSLTSRYPLGTNVFDREWDLLLVLDACRVDAMREVAPEYDFIDSVDSMWSVGSASHEWISKTYTTEHIDTINDTMLISTNPWNRLALKEGVRPPGNYSVPLMWPDWDVVEWSDLGDGYHIVDKYDELDVPPPPSFTTEHVIKAGREREFDRTIAHYMQPHIPHIAEVYEQERSPTPIEADPWDAIRSGEASREEIWEQYLDNLRLALDSIETIIENYDAETVAITADHGDLIGELGAYGHPAGFAHPSLKKVPWVTTTATDEETFTPTVELEEGDDEELESQLEALGYVGD